MGCFGNWDCVDPLLDPSDSYDGPRGRIGGVNCVCQEEVRETLGGMKPWRQWNAPLGVVQVLSWGFSLMAILFAWTGLASPYLSSLLATQQNFSDQHPFLYEMVRVSIAVMLLPLMGGYTFAYCYFYQRYYDRKIEKEKASVASAR
jgi:hypothetical protein